MRVAVLMVEAFRSVRQPQAIMSTIVFSAFVSLVAATLLTAGWVDDLRHAEMQSGRYVLEATATDEAGISALRCSDAANSPAIEASGGMYVIAIIPVRNDVTAQEPPVVAVTPGAFEVWRVPYTDGALVGAQLADVAPALGTSVQQLWVDGNPVRIAGTLGPAVPVKAFQASVVVPTVVDAPLSVCWVRYAPGGKDAAELALSAGLGLEAVVIADYSPISEDVMTSEKVWERFAGAHIPLIGGVFLAAFSAVVLVVRRREFAVFRISGVGEKDTFSIFVLEHLLPLTVVLPTAYAWGCAVVMVVRQGNVQSVALVIAAQALAAAAALYVLGVAVSAGVLSRLNPLPALKE